MAQHSQQSDNIPFCKEENIWHRPCLRTRRSNRVMRMRQALVAVVSLLRGNLDSVFSLEFSVVERRRSRYVVRNLTLDPPHKFHLKSGLNTMPKRTWSDEEMESLISHYRAHRELWLHRRHRDYDREKRSATCRKLAKIFKTTPAVIERKLNILKNGFHNEMRKMRLRTGYNTTWEYFPRLKFLKDRNSTSEGRARSVEPQTLEENPPQPSNIITPSPMISNTSTPEKTTQKPKLEEQAISNPPKNNDAEVFGNFVASAIRNLRSEARKRELKRKIQLAILETEELDEADQSHPLTTPSPISNTTNGILQDTEGSPPEVKMEFEHNFTL